MRPRSLRQPALLPTLLRFTLLLVSAPILYLPHSTRAADLPSIYVNDTVRWTRTGSWTLNTTVGNYTGAWIQATPPATGATASISFSGTGVMIIGTVVNGISGQGLNLSLKLDTNEAVTPTYTPRNISNGYEYNYDLYTTSSLSPIIHTLQIGITGESSPFLLQGIVYSPINIASESSTMPPATTQADQNVNTASNNSSENAKLGGAIGGGVGALLIVGLIILYMMRRIKRIEKSERKLQPRPYFGTPHTGSKVLFSPTTTVAGPPPSLRKNKESILSSVASPDKGKEKASLRKISYERPTASGSASNSHSYTPSYDHTSPMARGGPSRSRSQTSPSNSQISLPSEFQANDTLPPGTAVASSYIGTSPLPPMGLPEDAPPVPALPADLKRKSTKSSWRERTRDRDRKNKRDSRGYRNVAVDQAMPSPGSGLGLFSSESVNTIGSTGSALGRPLPIVPGTRSSAPVYPFPPEKVAFSPPPSSRDRKEFWPDEKKRPLPIPDTEKKDKYGDRDRDSSTGYPPPSR